MSNAVRAARLVGMRTTTCLVLCAALALGAGPAAQAESRASSAPAPQSAPQAATPEEQLKALDQEWRVAYAAFAKELQAQEAAGAAITQELFASLDPAPKFSQRYRALAESAKGSDTAAACLLKLLELDRGGNPLPLTEELMRDYAKSPALEKLARILGDLRWQLGSQRAEGLLRELIAAAPLAEVRAAGLFHLASSLMEPALEAGAEPNLRGNTPERAAEARELLLRIGNDYKSSGYAKRAEGTLFELEHLAIGKLAPDFEAIDVDGVRWKLSDYRGKVVVVDFWGYW